MNKMYGLPLFALALGALVTGASLAQAEGELDTQTENDLNTDMNSDIDTDAAAETQLLDSAVLIEIEDETVMHDGLTVSEIEGMDVYTTGDGNIGEVEEVLGDDSGQIQAFVVGISDGVFDLDARKVVVPADRMTLDTANDRYRTQLTQADIEGFDQWNQ